MKKWGIIAVLFLLWAGISCGNNEKQKESDLITIKTPHGNIKIRLFDKTAEHKKNFETLAAEGFYNGLLFHRVIPRFMIQGGDPESANAKPGDRLGGGSPGYTLPAEFIPEYYHKRGAVAAARLGGAGNPEKRSSGSQFYIVEGKVFTEGALDTMEMIKTQQIRNEMVRQQLAEAEDQIQQFRNNNDREGFALKMAEINERTDSLMAARNLSWKFTPEQRQAYTSIGGYPSLDGEYTVFGEVVEGMDVVKKIAAVETDGNNRPVQDITMSVEMLK